MPTRAQRATLATLAGHLTRRLPPHPLRDALLDSVTAATAREAEQHAFRFASLLHDTLRRSPREAATLLSHTAHAIRVSTEQDPRLAHVTADADEAAHLALMAVHYGETHSIARAGIHILGALRHLTRPTRR